MTTPLTHAERTAIIRSDGGMERARAQVSTGAAVTPVPNGQAAKPASALPTASAPVPAKIAQGHMPEVNPIFLANQVYELRAPKTKQGTVSGYFDDAALLYQAAQELDGKVAGIYFSMNPTNPALLARAKNRLQMHAKTTTSDADILKREWILIDADAVRPSEISSSEPEHQAALARCAAVAEWLTSQGWPEPVRADSGNGGHVLFRIDLPNDAASRDLVKSVLEVLALKFNDEAVVIDTGVYNAGRTTKLYGSMVCKGDSTDDRPHRRSQLLSVPTKLIPVSADVLQALASLRPLDPKPSYQGMNGTRFDLSEFMAKHGLVVVREKPWNGATVFELERCPFNGEHSRSSSIIQFPSGALTFTCFHNSCQSHHWQELKNRLEPNRGRQSGPTATAADPVQVGFTLISADSVTMKPVKWLIHGRVPLAMLTVLAGRGGMAKSTLGIEWGAQVTTGKAAGALAGSPGHVIICSTEDTEAETLTPRLTVAKADMGKVHFLHLHRGGLDGSLTIPDDIDILRAAILQSGARLVIIDPLMGHLSSTLNSWNDHEIRRALTPLSKLAEELTVSILVIAHLNKDSKKEAIDRIGGSIAISNTARSVLFAGPDPDDPEGKRKMLAHPKCNVGPEQPTLRYRIETVTLPNGADPIETTKIIWDGEAPGMTAEDLVARPEPVSREDRGRAVDWLEHVLRPGVRHKQLDLELQAATAGITKWMLQRAKPVLQIKSQKEGFFPGVWWWWREPAPNNTATVQPSSHNSANPLKNAKSTEDCTLAAFAQPSTAEDCSHRDPATFVQSSMLSTTYKTLTPEDCSQGLYREEINLVD